MPLVSSFNGSFASGRRASTDSFAGLGKSHRIIVHYDPSNASSYSGSGTTLTDLTSNGYNGTLVGSPEFETDHFNFTANDYFVTPDISSSIGASDVHTVELWFYPTGDNGVLLNYSNTSTPGSQYHFSAIEMVSGQLEFGLWNGSAVTSSGPTGSVTLDTWHQVVLTYDGSNFRGFLDGQRVCKVAVTFDSPQEHISTPEWYMAVGHDTVTNQGDGSDFEGTIGIFRVYDAKLNRSAIRRNYRTDLATHTAPVDAWSPADDITTAIWIDASDATSYTTSGSTVTAVTDKAGNYSFTVNGTPTVVSSALNSLPVFDFLASSNEDFTTTSEQAQTDVSGNHWAIGIFLIDSVDDTQDSLWSVENNTVSSGTKRDYAISAGNASAFNGELDLDGLGSDRISTTIGNKQDFDSGLSLDNYHIVSVIFNKTGNQIALRTNGSDAFTPVNDYDNAINQNQDVRIMRNRANERTDGRVAEFFTVAGAPGTGGTDITDVQKAEGYLAHKWGLESNLPSGHPYKSSAP